MEALRHPHHLQQINLGRIPHQCPVLFTSSSKTFSPEKMATVCKSSEASATSRWPMKRKATKKIRRSRPSVRLSIRTSSPRVLAPHIKRIRTRAWRSPWLPNWKSRLKRSLGRLKILCSIEWSTQRRTSGMIVLESKLIEREFPSYFTNGVRYGSSFH